MTIDEIKAQGTQGGVLLPDLHSEATIDVSTKNIWSSGTAPGQKISDIDYPDDLESVESLQKLNIKVGALHTVTAPFIALEKALGNTDLPTYTNADAYVFSCAYPTGDYFSTSGVACNYNRITVLIMPSIRRIRIVANKGI